MTIGDNIRKVAKEKDMSIYQLMKKSKVSQGYIYDLVNNKQKNPSIAIIRKIANVLEVPIQDLIN